MPFGARADPVAEDRGETSGDGQQPILVALAGEHEQLAAVQVDALDQQGARLSTAQAREQHDGEEAAVAKSARGGEQAVGLIVVR
jgi:hypothetical protein